jgi:hypothetical protein
VTVLELLHEPALQKQAFVDACVWADDIFLCLAWIEPGDSYGPSFSDLEPHQAKVRQAIVGLARFQSYPALLRRLYRSSVLRLVSTLDGSFSPNLYLFRKGSRVRVLVASAPFTSTRYARPCESFVVYEGDRDDAFALRALQLLDRCRASAHVPTRSELDAYEDAWAEARTGGRVTDAVAGLTMEASDASTLGELTLVSDAEAVRDALVEVRDSLAATATVRLPGGLAPRGATPHEPLLRTTLFWSAMGVWGALHRNGGRFGLHFGFTKPWEVERPVAALSLTAATTPLPIHALLAEGKSDVMAIAAAQDGRRLLVHLGAEVQDYGADLDIKDQTATARGSLIGEIGSADFVQSAAAFALRISRRRALQEEEAIS